MIFNSLAFGLFLPIVFTVYWLLRSQRRIQNFVVLVASYVFYGWWDWRFLGLIVISTIVDYGVGRRLAVAEGEGARKALLGLSLGANLGMLGVFKYYNFFVESLTAAIGSVGLQLNLTTLNVVLPVGISFYTFQTLSYTIDVYRRRMEPAHDVTAFAAYVAFFPQLVAGPIERASALLPQFLERRVFDRSQAEDGMRQILWGLFKKVAVADTCGAIVDEIYDAPGDFSSATLILGTVLFAIQIYGDFSGYSDIAIGTARLFGFRLMRNFAYPYFSRDIAEHWRRWHISLSTWFRDYVYFPLGGSRVTRGVAIRNIFVIFVVSGAWHGANWTYVVWGALNAAYFLPLYLMSRNRDNIDIIAAGRRLPALWEVRGVLITFSATCLGYIFFRSPSVTDAVAFIGMIFSPPWVNPLRLTTLGIAMATIMMGVEWIQREREHGLEVAHWPALARRSLYVVVVLCVAKTFGTMREFIYFQF